MLISRKTDGNKGRGIRTNKKGKIPPLPLVKAIFCTHMPGKQQGMNEVGQERAG